MPPIAPDSIYHVYRWMSVITGIGLLISTLECLFDWRLFCRTGLYTWRIHQDKSRSSRYRAVNALKTRAFDVKGTLGLLVLRAASIVAAFMLGGHPTLFMLTATLIVACTAALNYRLAVTVNGADQMTLIVWCVIWVYLASNRDGGVGVLGLWYVTLQACLSYVTSGVAKASSAPWRNGRAVSAIMNTTTYGNRRMAFWLQRVRPVDNVLTWATILFECAFPVCLLLNAPAAIALLLVVLSFHLNVGLFMGLNSFVWAFAGTYPAILYCRSMVWH